MTQRLLFLCFISTVNPDLLRGVFPERRWLFMEPVHMKKPLLKGLHLKSAYPNPQSGHLASTHHLATPHLTSNRMVRTMGIPSAAEVLRSGAFQAESRPGETQSSSGRDMTESLHPERDVAYENHRTTTHLSP